MAIHKEDGLLPLLQQGRNDDRRGERPAGVMSRRRGNKSGKKQRGKDESLTNRSDGSWSPGRADPDRFADSFAADS
ncbi:MAG: hypothetical protein Q8O99_02105 [bacterium]|nr:hypothetical protein [bacterium]